MVTGNLPANPHFPNTTNLSAIYLARSWKRKKTNRSFYNFGKDLPGGQMTWVEEYTKIIANLDSHLNQCSFQNSNISLADQTDFKNYILSDQNFLEKYAQLTT